MQSSSAGTTKIAARLDRLQTVITLSLAHNFNPEAGQVAGHWLSGYHRRRVYLGAIRKGLGNVVAWGSWEHRVGVDVHESVEQAWSVASTSIRSQGLRLEAMILRLHVSDKIGTLDLELLDSYLCWDAISIALRGTGHDIDWILWVLCLRSMAL